MASCVGKGVNTWSATAVGFSWYRPLTNYRFFFLQMAYREKHSWGRQIIDPM